MQNPTKNVWTQEQYADLHILQKSAPSSFSAELAELLTSAHSRSLHSFKQLQRRPSSMHGMYCRQFHSLNMDCPNGRFLQMSTRPVCGTQPSLLQRRQLCCQTADPTGEGRVHCSHSSGTPGTAPKPYPLSLDHTQGS